MSIAKSLVIPKTGYWESSVQTLPYSITQGNPFLIESNLPHKYRKMFQNVNYNI